jgi:acyl dehydratase
MAAYLRQCTAIANAAMVIRAIKADSARGTDHTKKLVEVAMIEWFDDLKVGMRYRGGEAEITRDDIKRFAAEFDPQPFHLDEAAAEKTIFKGLAASGWHTAATAMRLLVALRPFGPHPVLGLAVDELRWLAPSDRTPTWRIFVACWACAESGQSAATAPRSVMNSRRLIAAPDPYGIDHNTASR